MSRPAYGEYLLGLEGGAPELGAFGVDTTRNFVWAVIDHNSQFGAAVPEPAALTLLLGGLLAAGMRGRGR